MPIGETQAMIAGMTPTLVDGTYVFCTTPDPALGARCMHDAIGMFRELEGLSFLLPVERAEALGFSVALPMRQITLNVYSALDGVGLTAAVATALADHGIACNMVAAHHHDHVFVPAERATTAMEVLEALSRRETSS